MTQSAPVDRHPLNPYLLLRPVLADAVCHHGALMAYVPGSSAAARPASDTVGLEVLGVMDTPGTTDNTDGGTGDRQIAVACGRLYPFAVKAASALDEDLHFGQTVCVWQDDQIALPAETVNEIPAGIFRGFSGAKALIWVPGWVSATVPA